RVFESERKWGWEVLKEKQVSIRVKLFDRTKMNTDAGTSLFTESDGTLNDANPRKEVVSPSVIDEHVAMEVQSPLVAQTYSVKSHVVEETVTMECLVVNTPDVGLNPPLPTQEANSAGNVPGKPSYATTTGKPNGKKVNVRTLFTPGVMRLMWLFRWILFVILVNDLLIQLMGFSWEIRWHTLLLPTISIDGLDVMLENGPWFIGNNPLILKKWHPDENVLKEDVSIVLVWVKLHGVLVTAFSEDGLSAIETKLGTPLMLDSYTSDMCMQS
nr:hypothetical protein [Tanacetum cinerariifolium]